MSLDGIFSAVKDVAMTMQQGGGVGTDFQHSEARWGTRKRRQCRLFIASGPFALHGRVGQHVPYNHVCWRSTWGHDGNAPLRSSG